MFDIVRRRLPVAIALLVSVAITGGTALAQSDDEVAPSAIQSINVQKVDNLSAVKATSNLSKRAGKLMAVAGSGYLPNNIILKAMDSELLDGLDSTAFATLTALRSAIGAVNEADNLVHWNQLFGVPATVLAGDTTKSFIAGTSASVGLGLATVIAVIHPVGLDVETTIIPVENNAVFAPLTGTNVVGEFYMRSGNAIVEYIYMQNVGTVPSAVKVRYAVWNEGLLSPSAIKRRVKVSVDAQPPKRMQRLLKNLSR